MSHLWSEAEIGKVLKVRYCSQGLEYLIAWKNGERPTWELKHSFNKSRMLDEFDQKIKEKRAQQFPIFAAQQKYQHNQFIRRRTGVSQTSALYKRGSRPKSISGCVEISGVKFALIEYSDSAQRDLVRWTSFKRTYPELATKFIKSRCLQEIISN